MESFDNGIANRACLNSFPPPTTMHRGRPWKDTKVIRD